MKRALPLLAAALAGGALTLLWSARTAQAQPGPAATRCAAIPVQLVVKPDNIVNGKREGTTLPAGWTPVGGAGDASTGPLVVACTSP